MMKHIKTPEQIDCEVRAQLRFQQRKLVARMHPKTRAEAIALFKMPMAELVKMSVEQMEGVNVK